VLHFSAVLAPNQDMAFMIAIIWTAVNVMTSNFFILLSQMELRWLSHLRWLSGCKAPTPRSTFDAALPGCCCLQP
ncbi:uncharacterized protein HaLaN_17361, partial [Haematococcus lacustris]